MPTDPVNTPVEQQKPPRRSSTGDKIFGILTGTPTLILPRGQINASAMWNGIVANLEAHSRIITTEIGSEGDEICTTASGWEILEKVAHRSIRIIRYKGDPVAIHGQSSDIPPKHTFFVYPSALEPVRAKEGDPDPLHETLRTLLCSEEFKNIATLGADITLVIPVSHRHETIVGEHCHWRFVTITKKPDEPFVLTRITDPKSENKEKIDATFGTLDDVLKKLNAQVTELIYLLPANINFACAPFNRERLTIIYANRQNLLDDERCGRFVADIIIAMAQDLTFSFEEATPTAASSPASETTDPAVPPHSPTTAFAANHPDGATNANVADEEEAEEAYQAAQKAVTPSTLAKLITGLFH